MQLTAMTYGFTKKCKGNTQTCIMCAGWHDLHWKAAMLTKPNINELWAPMIRKWIPWALKCSTEGFSIQLNLGITKSHSTWKRPLSYLIHIKHTCWHRQEESCNRVCEKVWCLLQASKGSSVNFDGLSADCYANMRHRRKQPVTDTHFAPSLMHSFVIVVIARNLLAKPSC